MSILGRFASLALVALSLLILQGCDDEILGPGPGTGTWMEATVDGTKLTLPISLATYDSSIDAISFGGTIVGTPSKTVTVNLTFNIDQGTYPSTKTGSDVNIIYIISSASGTETYARNLSANNCTVTIASHSGDIIDGTFSGDLVNTNDTTKTIAIRDGKFSVKLNR